jgi:hypothetical protein
MIKILSQEWESLEEKNPKFTALCMTLQHTKSGIGEGILTLI